MNITRILLVDDHEVAREGLRRMLEIEPDIKVVGEAANAEEALAQVEQISPEVIITDIQMPGTDGIGLTRQIRQQWPSCKVIMLTLYDEYLPQAVEAGASAYLVKGVKRNELLRTIRTVCN